MEFGDRYKISEKLLLGRRNFNAKSFFKEINVLKDTEHTESLLIEDSDLHDMNEHTLEEVQDPVKSILK